MFYDLPCSCIHSESVLSQYRMDSMYPAFQSQRWHRGVL